LLAMSACGGAIVVWLENGGARAARMDPAVGWGDPTQIRARNAAGPAVAIDPNGCAAAVWTDYPAAAPSFSADLWVDTFVPGLGWQEPLRLDATGADDVADSFPAVAVDPGGRATAAWLRASSLSTLPDGTQGQQHGLLESICEE
jgi:hypothetical protein